MKHIIIILALALSLSPVYALAPIVPKLALVTRNDIQLMIARYAFVYDVKSDILSKVIFCESSDNSQAIGDKGHARGLVQIHDVYHSEITDEQAFDPEFSVKFLAKKISEGKGHEWSCWRKLSIL